MKSAKYFMVVVMGILMLTSENAMAAILEVDCATCSYDAAQGNTNPAVLLISVTDPNGNAVNGLGTDNFIVDLYALRIGGTTSVTSRAVESAKRPGFYELYITPTYESTGWAKATYLIGVTVNRGQDRGQAVAELMIAN